MIITNCPKCGSMNITTAGVCSYCGWSQFNKSMVSTDVLLDVATPIDVALRKRIAKLEAERRWIPVSERLPEDGETVFVIIHDGFERFENGNEVARLTYLGNGNWWSWESERYVVTHWMPLPKPPEVQE